MRQTSSRIFEGHCPGQTESFGADIGRHADAANCRAAGNVVDHDHGSQAKLRTPNMHQLQRSDFIGEVDRVGHSSSRLHCGVRPRAASQEEKPRRGDCRGFFERRLLGDGLPAAASDYDDSRCGEELIQVNQPPAAHVRRKSTLPDVMLHH